MSSSFRLVALSLVVLLAHLSCASAAFPFPRHPTRFSHLLARPSPSGDISVHDPSGITFDNTSSLYYAFGTGILRNEILASHVSRDGYNWTRATPPFTAAPSWVRTRVPAWRQTFWAPDLIQLNGWWHLYYAVSTFGSQTSCIGVTTNQQLDPTHADFLWIDRGPVICSSPSSLFNTIDPHVFVDSASKKVYMNYGSYWHGIFLVELTTSSTTSPFYNATTAAAPINLAYHNDSNRDLEASWIQHHPTLPHYYLFANWGQCCSGVNSTYNIRMARSTTGPTGPYIDAAGVDFAKGGGTLLITTDGRQIGPGQIGFPVGGMGAGSATPTVSYHYYDRDQAGLHLLGEGTFNWPTGDAWPTITDRE